MQSIDSGFLSARDNSPIFLCCSNRTELTVLKLAFEKEGLRLSTSDIECKIPELEQNSITIFSCNPDSKIDQWLRYVEEGGVLVLCNPNADISYKLGIGGFEGQSEGGILSLHPTGNQHPAKIQIVGPIIRYRVASGSIKGILKSCQLDSEEYPGIVEISLKRGKILVLLFSLAALISFFHQRTETLAFETGGGSAEKISLTGVNKALLNQPQLDMLLSYLTQYIIDESSRLDKPMPRFGYLPSGYRNLVTFSFDDFHSSGSAVKREALHLLSNLKQRKTERGYWSETVFSLCRLFKTIFQYFNNYRIDIECLIDLFKKYNSSATAFLLPFLGTTTNRPSLTGYKGMSKEMCHKLREAGWDVGTHIKPTSLNDYNVLQNKFVRRFGVPPLGHRGHELGWVYWIEDWQRLEDLGYKYDSTWNWGGHPGLAWIQGTAFPFHPTDQSGQQLSIFEMPVVAWVEDMYRTQEKSLQEITGMLDRFPGVYHFGAHSWKIKENDYFEFVEKLLARGQSESNILIGLNLRQLAEFWEKKEHSNFSNFSWELKNKAYSFTVESFCEEKQLSIFIPYYWKVSKVTSIFVNKSKKSFILEKMSGVLYAIITVEKGFSKLIIQFS